MAISSTVSSVSYAGSGTTGPFAITYTVHEEADLVVYKTNTSTGVVTAMALTTDYTVAATLDSITTVDPVASGYTLTIDREPAATQPTDFTPAGVLRESVLERALDRIVMLIQALARRITTSATGQLFAASTADETTANPGMATWTVAATDNFSAIRAVSFTVPAATAATAAYSGARALFLVTAQCVVTTATNMVVMLGLGKNGTIIQGGVAAVTSTPAGTGLQHLNARVLVELANGDTVSAMLYCIGVEDIVTSSLSMTATTIPT